MFSTLIAAVDGRQGGRDALLLAARLAGPGTTVHAVHVDDCARAEAEALVRRELDSTGVAAQAYVTTEKPPARGLHRAAVALDADLIVVGRAHRGPAGRIVAGDNARAVVHGAGRPVAVAPPAGAPVPAEPVVGVGYDGSTASRAALDWAAAFARDLGARLRVVSIAEREPDFSPSTLQGVNWAGKPGPREEKARRHADEAEARLTGGVEAEVLIGTPHEVLHDLSQELSVLVVGSRGEGAVGRALLGSVSDALVHSASCPVVVVGVPTGRRALIANTAPSTVGP